MSRGHRLTAHPAVPAHACRERASEIVLQQATTPDIVQQFVSAKLEMPAAKLYMVAPEFHRFVVADQVRPATNGFYGIVLAMQARTTSAARAKLAARVCGGVCCGQGSCRSRRYVADARLRVPRADLRARDYVRHLSRHVDRHSVSLL